MAIHSYLNGRWRYLKRRVGGTMQNLGDRLFLLTHKKSNISQRTDRLYTTAYGRPLQQPSNVHSHSQLTPSEQKRVEYYLGRTAYHEADIDSRNTAFTADTGPAGLMITDHAGILAAALSGRIPDGYTLPLLNLFNHLPGNYQGRTFLYQYGDHWRPSRHEGVIAKSRAKNDPLVSLLNLNPVRHWQYVHKIKAFDIPYQQKKSMAVWRGATTGIPKPTARREVLVQRYASHEEAFDIGFSDWTIPQHVRPALMKDQMTVKELLRYKILISVEGNDVASGLKWMLCSQSVVMMALPRTCSWLMEDKLEPFVHYIPLADDFSDLPSRFEWAMQNERKCLQISENASEYMLQFLDPERQMLIECQVLRRYLDNIRIG